jgi:hypothetical protein
MESIETDEQECLSDSHKNYMERYIAFELRRQEVYSDKFLSGKVRSDSSSSDSAEANRA